MQGKKSFSDSKLEQLNFEFNNSNNKKSKIRALYEKEKQLICIPVYKDDKRTLLNIGYSFFKSKKIWW